MVWRNRKSSGLSSFLPKKTKKKSEDAILALKGSWLGLLGGTEKSHEQTRIVLGVVKCLLVLLRQSKVTFNGPSFSPVLCYFWSALSLSIVKFVVFLVTEPVQLSLPLVLRSQWHQDIYDHLWVKVYYFKDRRETYRLILGDVPLPHDTTLTQTWFLPSLLNYIVI